MDALYPTRLFRAVFLSLFGLLFGVASSTQAEPPSREEVASWLRQREQLVRAMKCEFDCVCKIPDDPRTLAMIDQMQAKAKKDGLQIRYLRTPEDAEKRNLTTKWWRKGLKQRDEMFPLGASGGGEPKSALAYNGHLVTNISAATSNSPKIANVGTTQTAYWNGSPREDPYWFLFAPYEIPHSELVVQAKSFEAGPEVGEQGGTRVKFECSQAILSHRTLVLKFDNRHRLLEREFYNSPPGKAMYLRERMTYSDYEPHADPSGETFWCPKKIVNTLFLNGVPTLIYDYTIRDFELNPDLPDALFEMPIPEDAKIYDDVQGMGWLPQGDRPSHLFPAEAKRQRWLTGVAVAVVLALVLTGIWYSRRKRILRSGA